jgi:hypothetical protein
MTDQEFYERKKFDKWRSRTERGLPELAARVFALRSKFYMGCGFHWTLEKTLGYVINKITNHDVSLGDDIMSRISMEVIVEGLYKDVAKIERELTKEI